MTNVSGSNPPCREHFRTLGHTAGNQFGNMYQGDRPKLLEPRDEAFYNFTKGALKTVYKSIRIEQKIGKFEMSLVKDQRKSFQY